MRARAGAPHKWAFKARFRARAFGWRSQPAITRVREAVAEISKVAKKDPLLAAEGAIAFLGRVSAALEQVDSSSGAIGSAVYGAVAERAGIIAAAEVDGPPANPGWSDCGRRIRTTTSRISSHLAIIGASFAPAKTWHRSGPTV